MPSLGDLYDHEKRKRTTTEEYLSWIVMYPEVMKQEEEMLKTPFGVKGWFFYFNLLDDCLQEEEEKKNHCRAQHFLLLRLWIGQRAVRLLPGSYKLWRNHLLFQKRLCREVPSLYGSLLYSYRDALKRLHKMPTIWTDFLDLQQQQQQQQQQDAAFDATLWRHTVNHALEALPMTQHERIWNTVLRFLETTNDKVPKETKLVLLRRYTQFHPPYRQVFATRCMEEFQRPGEAAFCLYTLLNDHASLLLSSSSRHDLWMRLADWSCQHPNETRRVGIDLDALIRSALLNNHELGEMEGTLWSKLASYHIRSGDFDMARSVYEEAMEHVSRVRDFSILYDAYIQLEESLLESMMNEQQQQQQQDDVMQDHDDDWDILLHRDEKDDLEWTLSRAEHLTTRRPLLLNRVLLKQNPHNVEEWLVRAKLYRDNKGMAIATLEEALRTVHAKKASPLVLELAKLYDPDKARKLFRRVCLQDGGGGGGADECFAAWVELELQHEEWDEALSIARQASSSSSSLSLWDLRLDLEESIGTIQTTKDAYHEAMEQKVATPAHVLNFCSFLKEHHHFEEAFRAYERAIEELSFGYPAVELLWKTYLKDFLERYQGTKLERTRDLFARCLETCPESQDFYVMQGAFEEQYGLVKRALGVYKAMCEKVPSDKCYRLWIAKTTRYLGLPATRAVYQQAIMELDDCAKMCLDFAETETMLHELDRARAILSYGAQMAGAFPDYWKKWHRFEVSHGNEETFREMLRIKRSVQVSNNYHHNNNNNNATPNDTMTTEEALQMIVTQEGVELDESTTEIQTKTTTSSTKRPVDDTLQDIEDRAAKLRKVMTDQDEIDIDDSDDEPIIRTKQVPDAVLGELAKS